MQIITSDIRIRITLNNDHAYKTIWWDTARVWTDERTIYLIYGLYILFIVRES